MKVLWQYTRRTLAKNKVRTLVTILGIILSVSLFTAVAEGLISARQYGIDVISNTVGNYEAMIYGPDKSAVDYVINDSRVKDYTILNTIGYADNIGSNNEGKPYMRVCEITSDFRELVAVQLVKGRMPENDKEIILPEHLYINGGVEHNIGDKLRLAIGDRLIDGSELSDCNEHQPGENIKVNETREYTVVGFYERFNTDIELYSCPGYTALTRMGNDASLKEINDNSIIFVNGYNIDDMYGFVDDVEDEYVNHMFFCAINSRLLTMYGSSKDGGIMSVMIGLVTILFGLIMLGSVMLIYNSFSISVSERVKQFGLLKSIGATRRQIMMTVIYEALYLCVLAIPLGLIVGCLGIGITLRLLRSTFDTILGYGNLNVYMGIHIEPVVLLLVACLGIITVIISALIPAFKVIRIQPIDAVKQSGDVKLRRKDVRTLGIAGKVFGFEGMIAAKNYRRSRKKYRTTVISLFVSIVLFISASSFTHYLTKSADMMVEHENYDVEFSMYNMDDCYEVYNELKAIKGVTDSIILLRTHERVVISEDVASEYYSGLLAGLQGIDADAYITTKDRLTAFDFVPDDVYDRLVKENGIKLVDSNIPQALLFDDLVLRSSNSDGSSKWEECSTFRHDSFPMKLTAELVAQKEGYVFNYSEAEYNENNELVERYYYAKEDLAESDEYNDNILELNRDEALETYDINVAGIVKEGPMGVDNTTTLIYKASDMNKVFGDREVITYPEMFFVTTDHNDVSSQMLKISDRYSSEHNGRGDGYIYDCKAASESERAVITIINVFSYGFIILISLIAVANVFNTISTNILLRRREFAMLKSVGMSATGNTKMMCYECILYGFKGLLYGIPASLLISYMIYQSIQDGISTSFYVPASSVVIAVGSVFVVVFATMIYSLNRIKKDNILDTLRKESI